jgi:hypothetical protein
MPQKALKHRKYKKQCFCVPVAIVLKCRRVVCDQRRKAKQDKPPDGGYAAIKKGKGITISDGKEQF